MQILLIIQIIVSVFLATFILMQQRGAALGSAFGGGGDSFYSKKRGAEKYIFIATIITAVIFVVLSITNLII